MLQVPVPSTTASMRHHVRPSEGRCQCLMSQGSSPRLTLAPLFAVCMHERRRTMFSSNAKQGMLSTAVVALVMAFACAAHAEDTPSHQHTRHKKTNINLAVASNFYGVPPDNSAITDLIVAFEAKNPGNRVTIVDNGATSTLAD